MVVFFSASARTLKQDIDTYRQILSTIWKNGCLVAHDWVETGWRRMVDRTTAKTMGVDWKVFAHESMEGIERADVVVIEASGFSSFGVGFEAAVAMQFKKPTLILIKKNSIQTSYACGLMNDLVEIKAYDEKNLGKVITKFLKENVTITRELRFNFAIDHHMHNYLRRRAYELRKTKAELLRDLLRQDMESDSQ